MNGPTDEERLLLTAEVSLGLAVGWALTILVPLARAAAAGPALLILVAALPMAGLVQERRARLARERLVRQAGPRVHDLAQRR
jgi:hypothetical protein